MQSARAAAEDLFPRSGAQSEVSLPSSRASGPAVHAADDPFSGLSHDDPSSAPYEEPAPAPDHELFATWAPPAFHDPAAASQSARASFEAEAEASDEAADFGAPLLAPEPAAPEQEEQDEQLDEDDVIVFEKRKKREARIRAALGTAWAAGQTLLFAFLVVAALFVARGGTSEDLAFERLVAVILGNAYEDDSALRVIDVVTAKRATLGEPDLVIVSGFVVNDTASPIAAARVDVRFDDGTPFSAYVNSLIDGVAIAEVRGTPNITALSMTVPDVTTLQPGDHAPFVVLANGIPEGARARIRVSAVARPAAAPVPQPLPPRGPRGTPTPASKPSPTATVPPVVKPVRPVVPPKPRPAAVAAPHSAEAPQAP